jgi:glycosyltransferase involved in cell wall biosynthesis
MVTSVASAILFSPRGGSAHVARALARGLRSQGRTVTMVAGSRGDLGIHGDARCFYDHVQAVDFTPALASGSPLRYEGPPGTAPMHPSFEDRLGARDRVFARLDDLDYERQVRAWSRELERGGAHRAEVLHLHHLTPLNEAAARIAPQVPIVGQLHGTELLMLEAIASGPPDGWRCAERWADRLRAWGQCCARLVVAPAGVQRARSMLDVPRERVVSLPNGVDTNLFRPRTVDRLSFWRRVLVEHPLGWLPGQGAGSARYDEADAARLAAGTVLLYVGRFTAVKRLDRLIEAFGQARRQADGPVGLALVGGHPDEWEGEHPAQVAQRLGVDDVFLAGWYSQEELPDFFGAADALALVSEREQFGQVLIEGMACGLPVVATRALGPETIVEDGRTGWLASPHDQGALVDALTAVVSDPNERIRRGRLARDSVRERFEWQGISARLGEVLDEVGASAANLSATASRRGSR